MNNHIRILLIVIFFSGCSDLSRQSYDFNFSLEDRYANQKYWNKTYIGMTREQIVYIFGMPIISDSFDNVYHYYIYHKKTKNVFQKKMLSLYFKNDKVLSYDFK